MPTDPSDQYPQPLVPEPSPVAIVDFLREMAGAAYDLIKHFGALPLVYGGMDDTTVTRLQRLAPDVQFGLTSAARDLQPFYRWSTDRQVYPVHPATTRGLVAMTTTVPVPSAQLRRLRHPNPLFVLPGAPAVHHPDGRQGRVIAFFVVGAISARYAELKDGSGQQLSAASSVLRSTDSDEINAYHAMVVSEVLDPTGTQVIDHDYCRITIPLIHDFTLEALVDATVDGFNWERVLRDEGEPTAKITYMRTIATVVISHLLYAISKNAEIDKPRNDRPPAKRGKTKNAPKPVKPARMMPMGYRLGNRLAEFEQRQRDEGTRTTATGAKKAPHIRGAHLHTFRVGTGRAEIDVKLLAPIAVNAHLDDHDTATIHHLR